jgi:DNA-binding NarL/FixJ family response regulator
MIHLQHVDDHKPIIRNWERLTKQLNFDRVVVHTWAELSKQVANTVSLNTVWIDFEFLNSDDLIKNLNTISTTLELLNTINCKIAINVPHLITVCDLDKLTSSKHVSVIVRSDLSIKRISESCVSSLLLGRTYVSPSVTHMLLNKPALFSRTQQRKPHISWLVPSCSSNMSNNMLQDLREHHRICINSFESWTTFIRCLMMPKYVTDVVIIDHAVLANTQSVSLIDAVSCVHTIYQIKSPTNISQFKLCVAVDDHVDHALMRQIAKTPRVSSLMPVPGSGFSHQDLESAVDLVLQNKSWSPTQLSVACAHKSNSVSKQVLTNRQQQILDLVVKQGSNNKVIANRLKITEGAVKSHISKLLKKFGVSNRTELAALNHS